MSSKGKMLQSLEIRRGEDGAHVVEHHHASDHPPETHKFREKLQMLAHVDRHSDRLEPGYSQIEEGSQPDSGGRPARFDHGSSRTSEIEGE